MKALEKQPYGPLGNITVAKVLSYVEPAQPETEIEKIFAHFSENNHLLAIPVVKNGRPVGLINRYTFVDSLAQPCSALLSLAAVNCSAKNLVQT